MSGVRFLISTYAFRLINQKSFKVFALHFRSKTMSALIVPGGQNNPLD